MTVHAEVLMTPAEAEEWPAGLTCNEGECRKRFTTSFALSAHVQDNHFPRPIVPGAHHDA